MIRVKNLRFSYSENGPLILKGVDFLMQGGEFVAILGGNGSGKSTFVKVLNGLCCPYEGEVSVFGLSPINSDDVLQIRRKLGMVFQNPENQVVGAVVEDDVAFSLENMGCERELMRKRVDESLELCGLDGKRNNQTANLSGGQMQRLAIASILAMRPDIIVFDEATSMLDPVSKEEIFNLIVSLCRDEGIGVIYITHFMDEAVYADRVLVMKDGCIEAQGRPADVFNRLDLLKRCGLTLPKPKALARDLGKHGVELNWKKILLADDLLTELENRVHLKK